MKKNLLKKMGILGLASLALIAPTTTKADTENEKICTTYKNYYLFLAAPHADSFINGVYNSTDGILYAYNSAVYPGLPDNAEPSPTGNVGFVRGRICLTKDGKSDAPTANSCQYGTWSLDDYYTIKAEVASNSQNKKKVTYTYENEQYESNIYEKQKKENGNRIIERYISSGAWWYCSDEDCSSMEQGTGIDTSKLAISKLVKGSYLPAETLIDFQIESTQLAKIKRKQNIKTDFTDYITIENGNPKVDNNGNLIFNNNSTALIPFNIGTTENPDYRILAPAAYYVQYQTCEDAYTGTIDYFYFKDNKPTTERVDFDNSHDNPYTVKLAAGESEKVPSPVVSGCTIVDANGKKSDADKEVTLSIDATNPQNISKKVYYYCKTNEEPKSNANTGDALIYLAWAVGLGAIGYSVYYFKKVKKEEV